MKTMFNKIAPLFLILALAACDRKNDDLVDPRKPEDFPLVIVLSDEGDGDLEDNDEIGINLEILPLWDAATRSVDGKVTPPKTDVTVSFKVIDPKGFSNLSDYITGGKALYEIDDCTTSEDENINLNFTWDAAAGTGSFRWPAGVAEVEVVFEVKDDFFDDAALSSEDRGFTFQITSVQGAGDAVKVNTDLSFEYQVLDEEGVFGSWELDASDSVVFADFLALFTPLNKDLEGLTADKVDKIEISFEYDKMEVKVELVETEEDECDPTEQVPLEIEIEGDYAIDLDDLFNTLMADLELEGSFEDDNDNEVEFVLKGKFEINMADPSEMTLTLEGEFNDTEIAERSLKLKR